MSAKNRGSKIISQEFYPTPEYTINSILEHIDFTNIKSFKEPCRGDGAIYNKIPNEVLKTYAELSEGIDYLKEPLTKVDLIVTNPPFSIAKEFIEKSIKEAKCVVMLLRLNYLGSQQRKKFWQDNQPSHLFVLSQRPKFIGTCTNKRKDSNNQKICTLWPFSTALAGTKCECGSNITESSDATEYAFFIFCNTEGLKFIYEKPGVYVI